MRTFLPGPGPLETSPRPSGGGPTVYNQSVSAALSFAGTDPVFAMTRTLAAALSFVGAVTRILTLTRTLTAGASFSGSVTRTLSAVRTLTAALSFTGAAPLAGISRRVTATFTPAGAVSKQTLRKLAASITPTGTVASSRAFLRTVTASLSFSGSLTKIKSGITTMLLQAGVTFIGGAQLYPDPNLYPAPDQYPFGGAILFQLNRTLNAILQAAASITEIPPAHANSKLLTAILQPQVAYLKTTARVFLAAQFSAASLIAVRSSHTVAQALFASLRNAGSLHTITNAGVIYPGGGGHGVPMPDSFFQRYQPTLRRQKVKV